MRAFEGLLGISLKFLGYMFHREQDSQLYVPKRQEDEDPYKVTTEGFSCQKEPTSRSDQTQLFQNQPKQFIGFN